MDNTVEQELEKAPQNSLHLKVGIVEDDRNFLEKMVSLLGGLDSVQSIKTWGSSELFWREGRREDLDLLFIDINLPVMDGIELAGMLNLEKPDMMKVMITTVTQEERIFQALRNGCIGYIYKADLDSIENVIQIVARGGAIISPTIALRIMNSYRKDIQDDLKSVLTDRERQVLELMASGNKPARVADILHLSLHTVRCHVRSIYKKLNISNQQELMQKAISMGYSIE